MDDDLRKNLLNKKTANFDKLYEQCTIKIGRIKQKNDFMQKQIGTDIEETVKKEVANQKKFIQKEIKELKFVMDDMEKKFKDPESKNKLKNIKIQAQKQIQRNKVILKDFINKSFLKISHGSAQSSEDAAQFMEEGKVNYSQFNSNSINKSQENSQLKRMRKNSEENQRFDLGLNNQSLLTDQNLDLDFEIQRKILHEKNELLNQVQQTTIKVNEIMNDMAVMVNEQGQNLQIISEDMMNANKNVIQANKELVEANRFQRKSRRKYLLFALLLLVLIGGVLALVLWLPNR